MKLLTAISRHFLFGMFALLLLAAPAISMAQQSASSAPFKVYSFNSKIPILDLPANRLNDVTVLGQEGRWTNVRIQNGIPAWVRANEVARLNNGMVRVNADNARIYITPSNNSRYLVTLSKGYTSEVVFDRGDWLQVSAPAYLTLKVLSADYRRLTSGSLPSNSPSASVQTAVVNKAANKAEVNKTTAPTPAVKTSSVASSTILPKTGSSSVVSPVQSSVPSAVQAVYLLTPGDVISISVFGEPEMVLNNQRIGENGFVSFPLIGQVEVKGKTAQQVEQSIESLLAKGYLRDPKVNVVINAYRPLYVRGAVITPGAYDFTEGLTVAKALTLSGGITADAVTDTLKLYRNDELFLQNLTIDSQMLMQPGDILTVEKGIGVAEKASLFIYLHGEVKKPGGYEYREGLTVEKAVALAGGFSPRASKRKINISREVANQDEPEKIKKVKLFFDLKPGDVIHVGASWF